MRASKLRCAEVAPRRAFALGALMILAILVASCVPIPPPVIHSVDPTWSYVDRRYVPREERSFAPFALFSMEEQAPQNPPGTLVAGYPLIQTKGMVEGGDYLYISDTGKDKTHDEAAKIWRLNPETGELTVFYTGDLLVNSKWLYYQPGSQGQPDELIISDYGRESAPRQPGTGEGAKVFAIPVLPDGNAGEPRVLHAGPPFQSPEGITVIGDTVIVADWAAGPITSRPGAPDVKYKEGALFALPLAGGEPTELFPEHQWVTLIGVCGYEEHGADYLMIIDLDSGRPDLSTQAALPQSGTPEFFRVPILSANPLRLGALERVVISEDGPLTVNIPDLRPGQQVLIETGPGTTFDDNSTSFLVTPDEIDPQGDISVIVRSDMSAPAVPVTVTLSGVGQQILTQQTLIIPKNPEQPCLICDNKHAGSALVANSDSRQLWHFSADGTSHSVVVFPGIGGTPVTLWRETPMKEPMAVQTSEDYTKLYVTDQAAGPEGTSVIWIIDTPPEDELRVIFPAVQ